MITLPCHGHQLTLLRRSANFNCNACKLSGKGSSYLCYTCQFWIHKSCALSPTTIELDYHHHHRLNLNYKYVSSKFSDYKDRCNRCRKEIIDGSWAYRCEAQCKYFVHFECAISTLRGGGRKNGAEMKENGKDDLDINLIRLPLAGDSLDLVRYFVEHSNQEETKGETTIDHWTHDHQLILVDKHHNNEMKGDQKICNGCVQPISPPYYICEICNYFLHISCANLPKTLRLPGHPKHLVQCSQYSEFYKLFKCKACKSYSNGFYYKCGTCKFYLDVKCAFLPLTITHEADEHPLVETECVTHKCHACHYPSRGMRFRCDSCKFNLSYKCALLPHTIRHRWDKHPLNLFYKTINDHPDEFYCEYCEEEINPQCWLYHCGECDQSFHPRCVFNGYSNTKFGGIVEVDEHPHSLMFVQTAKRMSTCCRCGSAFKDCPSFECQVCYYAVCQRCLDKLHVKNSKGWGK
ncbi:unnamed protein product [Ilex paraguariensis]|uniref:C2H2-type domain-containing protein n=1 Tax=Ilex paraguariensis TaxID=185542 RepID=A0ABC8SN04_9AQUA